MQGVGCQLGILFPGKVIVVKQLVIPGDFSLKVVIHIVRVQKGAQPEHTQIALNGRRGAEPAIGAVGGLVIVAGTDSGDILPTGIGADVGIGDGLTMLCGFFYALQIIITSRAVEERSVLLINVLQFTVVAVLCGIFAPFVSPFPRNAPVSAWLSIAYLCVMCTAVCFMLQGYGQKYTPPQSTAIILTLESVFGTAISLIFYDEQITLRIALGFIMIFVSVIISETKLSFIQRRERLAVKQAEQ